LFFFIDRQSGIVEVGGEKIRISVSRHQINARIEKLQARPLDVALSVTLSLPRVTQQLLLIPHSTEACSGE
jgi:hypothetical protein